MSRGGLVGLAGKEAERDSPDGVAAEQPQRLGASKALNLSEELPGISGCNQLVRGEGVGVKSVTKERFVEADCGAGSVSKECKPVAMVGSTLYRWHSSVGACGAPDDGG